MANSKAHDARARHIAITGASSGLGAALARHYAHPGRRLSLFGRDPARLDAVVAACQGNGAVASGQRIDVRDAAAMRDALWAADAAMPIDLLIANAGIAGQSGDDDSERLVLAVNVTGVLNTVAPILPRMRQRAAGQIAVMSSLAGLRGLPGAAAYSASKNWVRAYGEALRAELLGSGVRVSVICPGFVDTPLTARNRFPMPFMLDDAAAATRIAHGLARDRARIAFPRRLYAVVWFLA
ncbi:MAG: SDR family NAD(P)-dependent oxidoreductase, partial [Geminicoccaceae bacterium]